MKRLIIAVFFIMILSACAPTVSITLDEGVDTIEVYGVYQIKGCTVTIDGVDYRMTVKNNPVDVNVVGNYLIEYEYEFNSKTYECQRVVFIVDQTAPIITLNPGIDTIILNQEWEDAGVIVTDNYDTEFVIFIDDSALNTNVVGDYMVSYTVTDQSYNETVIYRVVHVVE